MDLMFIESRPRARDAVVSSFAKLALERSDELTPAQRQKLTEYFIDLHNKLPALQQHEVEAAARKIAGDDVADLMQGKGMASDDELQVQRDYKRALQESQRAVTQ
jgi:ABC-type phosphate/phosphonate transport system substrate-binding protein